VSHTNIPEKIKTIRELRGLDQAASAEKCGTHYNVIKRLENGSNSPNAETLIKIADGLGFDLQVAFVPKGKP
jgi:transcriptional regulator with XRE-family HTH domain